MVGVSSAISCSLSPVFGSVSRPAGILVALGVKDREGIAVDVFTVNVAVDVYVGRATVRVFDAVIVHVAVNVLVGGAINVIPGACVMGAGGKTIGCGVKHCCIKQANTPKPNTAHNHLPTVIGWIDNSVLRTAIQSMTGGFSRFIICNAFSFIECRNSFPLFGK
jgi:hypothetical protein